MLIQQVILFSLAGIAWSMKITEENNLLHIIRRVNWPWFIRKPLYECAPCVSGQMMFWWSFFYAKTDVISTLLMTAATIGLTLLIEVWTQKR